MRLVRVIILVFIMQVIGAGLHGRPRAGRTGVPWLEARTVRLRRSSAAAAAILSAWRKIIDGLPRPILFPLNGRLTAPRDQQRVSLVLQTALFRKPTFFLIVDGLTTRLGFVEFFFFFFFFSLGRILFLSVISRISWLLSQARAENWSRERPASPYPMGYPRPALPLTPSCHIDRGDRARRQDYRSAEWVAWWHSFCDLSLLNIFSEHQLILLACPRSSLPGTRCSCSSASFPLPLGRFPSCFSLASITILGLTGPSDSDYCIAGRSRLT